MARRLGLSITAFGLLVVAAAFSVGSGADSWGPRMFPLLGGLVMAAAGIAISFERAPKPAAGNQSELPWHQEARAFWLMILGALYVLLLPRIGYLLSTALVTPLVFTLFGVRSPLSLLLATAISPIALYIFFFQILGVFPPFGAWFDLADHIPF